MKISSVSLKNFMSHGSTEIDFSDARPYLFIGSNGSGKSSLIKDSITFALFGEARGKGAGDDMIRGKEKSCSATVTFFVGDVMYRVTRTRVRNKSTELEFWRRKDSVFEDISGPTATATQADIVKTLGFDQQVFSLSACLEQGNRLNFSELTPKQAKDVIMSILKTECYGRYEQKTREELQQVEKEILSLTGAIEYAKIQLSADKRLDGEIESLEEQRRSYEASLEKEKSELEARKLDVKSKMSAVEAELSTVEAKVETLRNSYREKDSASAVLSQKLVGYGQDIYRLGSRIKKMSQLGGSCPECELPLTEEHLKKVVSSIDTELKDKAKERDDINTQFLAVRAELTTMETEGRSYDVTAKRDQLKELNEQLVHLAQGNGCGKLSSLISGVDSAITEKKKQKASFQQQAKETQGMELKIKDRERQQRILKYLLEAFGKNGIPAMVIYNMIDELENGVNRLLRNFTDRNISVRMAMEKNLKSSNELSDTFEILIRDGVLERPYQLYSGGEKFRIDLAIRLAIAALLARRNNFSLETLILDEPAFLDKQGLANLKDILVELSSCFSRIFVISHLTELIDDAGSRFNVVEVGSRNGESFIKRR